MLRFAYVYSQTNGFIRWTLILLLLSISSAGASNAFPAPFLEARASVFVLIQKNGITWDAICTGAMVELKDGPRAVTAGHCVSDEPKAGYALIAADGKRWRVTGVEDFVNAWPADYAILRSEAEGELPALSVAPSDPQLGEELYVWDGPLGMTPFPMRGDYLGLISHTFSRDRGPHEGMRLVNFNADRGASGSIVMNENAEAVGILVGIFAKGPRSGVTALWGSMLSRLPAQERK